MFAVGWKNQQPTGRITAAIQSAHVRVLERISPPVQQLAIQTFVIGTL
jgi:hypothetical protein